MRHFKDGMLKFKTIFQLFACPLDYKRRHIERLSKQFPNRTFHLIGDSVEKDLGVYAEMFKQFPSQVDKIWIRNVNNATAERMEGVPPEKWSFLATELTY